MNQPKTIWLQPWCEGCAKSCASDGRQWCEDEVWGQCEDCDEKPVKYVLAGLSSSMNTEPKR
jgi:hypothetical protein